MEQMKADEGITAESKARDKMKWVGLMNNLWSSAEEIVIRELIFMRERCGAKMLRILGAVCIGINSSVMLQ